MVAFKNELTSSLSDLITKLNTHLTGNGWTGDQLDTGAGKWAVSKGTVFLSARWDTVTPDNLGIYQALAFDGVGTDPGNHTDDSGNGAVSGTDATIATERSVQLSNTPVQYWAYVGTGGDDYVHVVVEESTASYRHFGFGLMSKVGDWTGGEYAYGHRIDTGGSLDTAIRTGSTHLLDGLAADGATATVTNMEKRVGTVHIEGLPNQVASSKWGITTGNQGAPLGNDRAGNGRNRINGGFRGGPIARPFGKFSGSAASGLIPMYPIGLLYTDSIVGGKGNWLGFMIDVRGININSFVGGDTVTIGAETWTLFPSHKKGAIAAGITGNQGIAYRQA